MKKKFFKKKCKEIATGYIFIGPFIIGFLAFILIPIIYSFYLSFTDYNILSAPKWVGLDNFIKMFTEDDRFWMSFKVTWKYALVSVPLSLIASLLVAVALAKPTKLTGAYRVIFYIPSLLGGTVAMAITWKQIFETNGVINQILESVGIPTVKWLYNPKTALYVLVFMSVWAFGSQMLIFVAGIKNIPSSLQEAAIVDGASPIRRFFSITLPMLSPVIFYNLVNSIIGSLQAFNGAYLVTNGGPLDSTLYYGLYQYQMAFDRMHMGYASAMAWFLMLVIVLLTALIFKSSSGWVYFQDEG